VLRREGASLALAAETYAKVGCAVADAFIACWHQKYVYNLLRPVTYIRAVVDPSWASLLATPPFPEYPSGHSVQSGAAFQVLTDLFGAAYAFTDHSHDARGLAPRSFGSFFEAAEEAAISRLYGGIHFRAAIENGVEQGKCIGQAVSALPIRD
jgi:membrane-associated phospholipid phosphatase